MADAKVTDLQSAVTLNPVDVLYLVQSGTDKKLTIANLLGNLPATPAKFRGVLALGGTPQTLVGAGTVSATETTTLLSNVGSVVINIADGLHESQIKIIVMNGAGGTSTLSDNIGVGQIQFSAIGHSVVLVWIAGLWWPIGGTANITT